MHTHLRHQLRRWVWGREHDDIRNLDRCNWNLHRKSLCYDDDVARLFKCNLSLRFFVDTKTLQFSAASLLSPQKYTDRYTADRHSRLRRQRNWKTIGLHIKTDRQTDRQWSQMRFCSEKYFPRACLHYPTKKQTVFRFQKQTGWMACGTFSPMNKLKEECNNVQALLDLVYGLYTPPYTHTYICVRCEVAPFKMHSDSQLFSIAYVWMAAH